MFSPRCQLAALREDVHFCPAQHQSSAHCVPDAGQSTAHGNARETQSWPWLIALVGPLLLPAAALWLLPFSLSPSPSSGSPSSLLLWERGTAEGPRWLPEGRESYTSAPAATPVITAIGTASVGEKQRRADGGAGQSALPGDPTQLLGGSALPSFGHRHAWERPRGPRAGAGRGHGGQLGWGQGSRGGAGGLRKMGTVRGGDRKRKAGWNTGGGAWR